MAKKKLKPLEDPPTASSSNEEEMETLSGEEEEEVEEQISDDSLSEEEDELMNIPSGKNPKTPSSAVQGRTAVSSAVNQVSDMNPSKPGKKRPSEKTSNEVNAKRAVKKVSGDGEKKNVEDTNKPLFQRLWNEEDEISLLQGMIDFKAETGYSPYEDMDGFYELTMKSISFEASKNQLMDKIRSLKKKCMRKVKHIWGVEFFSKAHDKECLKLAKCIWGFDGMSLKSNGTPKKSKKKLYSLEANGKRVEEEDRDVLVNGKKVEEDKEVLIHGGGSESFGARESDWFEDSFLVRCIAGLGVDEHFVKQRWNMVAAEIKTRMEEKWKLLQAKEMEIVLKKIDFMREVGSVIAET